MIIVDKVEKTTINIPKNSLGNLTYNKPNADLSDYYTKEQVDELIDNVEVDLSDYYTKEQVDELIDNVEVDLSGYATEQWVEEKKYLQIQPNNEIWYTSRLGEVIYPVEENFDANIVSNTYENGKGVIVFDKDITVVGNYVFSDTTITSIDIPNSVTSIGKRAFGYSALTNITIPNSVTSIGEGAFNNCLLLYSIDIPNSVISIGDNAFESCKEIVNVSIGSSVTSIGKWAFYECEKIENITIPNSVTSIGNSAFEYCSNLQNVYCKSITPPVGGNYMFDYCSSELKIYVPINSVDAYKTADYWSNYADSIIGCVFEDDIIVSGVNIKTINGKSILGEGNIEISGSGTTDLSNYYTKTESDAKYLTKVVGATIDYVDGEIENVKNIIEENVSDTAAALTELKQDIPTNISQLTNDSNYTTQNWVENNFATNSDVNDEIGKLDSSLTSIINQKQNTLVSGENIKTINGESILGSGNIEISSSGTTDLSNYYTKTESDNKFQEKGNYLTSVPDEYVTESELTAKNYATKSEIPTIPTNVSSFTNDAGYITNTALDGYATETYVSDTYQVKGNYLTSIPSEYVTDTELTNKGYATETYVDTQIGNINTILENIIG